MPDLEPKWGVSVKFEPHDLWVGVYWRRLNMKKEGWTEPNPISIYICPLPCLCVKIERSLRSWHWVKHRGRYYHV